MKLSIGIDVGKSGGIAVIYGEEIHVYKTPLIAKGEIDIGEIKKIIVDHIIIGGNKDQDLTTRCVIEDVHSIFGVGAKSNFQFGRSLGILEGITMSLGISMTKIAPKTWQKEMWQGIQPIQINTGKKTKEGNIKYKVDTKGTSLIACKRTYPNVNLLPSERSTKPHDGIVDALLLAGYAHRKLH